MDAVATQPAPSPTANPDSRPRAIVAGGSGFVGKTLVNTFAAQGWDVVVLSRSERPAIPNVRYATWDGARFGAWVEEIEGAAAVVNLTGENIGQSWSKDTMDRIVASRVESTRVLGEAISEVPNPPKSWVNGSAMGIFGNRGDEILDESNPIGPKGDFLVDTCVAWESEADRFARDGVALAKLRSGHVLGPGGGLLKPLALVTKCFLGGPFGNGTQYMSWIHIDDLCQLILWIATGRRSGIYNCVSPDAVTNEFFMATLRAVLNRPWAPPIPGFMLSLAELFGAPPAKLMLDGQRLRPARALEEGFVFKHTHLHDALSEILRRR